jgi:hypothetical protein
MTLEERSTLVNGRNARSGGKHADAMASCNLLIVTATLPLVMCDHGSRSQSRSAPEEPN